MVRNLIAWALNSKVVVLLLVATLIAVGFYSFTHVNVEAYPDPAPAIIEVIAQYPGASAEEVERQVAIPIEVAVAGISGLQSTRSKSLFGLSYVSNQFAYGVDYSKARQDVIVRLQQADLPPGVAPQISPASPIAEIVEYVVIGPQDARGRDIYTLNDLKAIHAARVPRTCPRPHSPFSIFDRGGRALEQISDSSRFHCGRASIRCVRCLRSGAPPAARSGGSRTRGSENTVA